MLKAREMRKLMKHHFLMEVVRHDFSLDHTTGYVVSIIDSVILQIGYELEWPYSAWAGGGFQIRGLAGFEDRAAQYLWVEHDPRQSVMPPKLRMQLRSLAGRQLRRICDRPADDEPPEEFLSTIRGKYRDQLVRMDDDPFFVPIYHYFDGDDVLSSWCSAVTPHIPDMIRYLIRAARNTSDAEKREPISFD